MPGKITMIQHLKAGAEGGAVGFFATVGSSLYGQVTTDGTVDPSKLVTGQTPAVVIACTVLTSAAGVGLKYLYTYLDDRRKDKTKEAEAKRLRDEKLEDDRIARQQLLEDRNWKAERDDLLSKVAIAQSMADKAVQDAQEAKGSSVVNAGNIRKVAGVVRSNTAKLDDQGARIDEHAAQIQNVRDLVDAGYLPSNAEAPAFINVLIVEDDVKAGGALMSLLKAGGIPATWARNIAEAKECVAAKGPFTVAALDLNLPDGDPGEIAELIRAQASPGRVVIVSGEKDAVRIASIKADQVFEKPLDFAKFELALRGKS